MTLQTISGQPSWQLENDTVHAAVSRLGGMLAPVRFRLPKREVQPFSISPWATERLGAGIPSVLKALRGDFLCMPFGGNEVPFQSEQHPPHGETASRAWSFVSTSEEANSKELLLRMETKIRPARVDKMIRLVSGHTAVYLRHTIEGMRGPMTFGHHATLAFPAGEGSARISSSPLTFGQVCPTPFEDPTKGGYPCLRQGARFDALERVPAADGSVADLSVYPAREGFEDLVMFAHAQDEDFAWTAAVVAAEGYVWFALKDPRVLTATACWMSNGGRHYAPWNGRHRGVLGLEDVTSCFHFGIEASAAAKLPFVTSHDFDGSAFVISYIMGVAPVPKTFGKVKLVERTKRGVVLTDEHGKSVRTAVDHEFLHSA